ncbi:16S rRNA (guanine(966)-N(2))-methyltransferase RsmD [Arcanobacterium hippocoleae]
MTRIVAGKAKGRILHVPKSGTRPTSERVREALFSRLEHYGYLADCAVLDLFAGSGALAFEALSRGAQSAVCVEMNSAAAKVINDNARTLGFNTTVINQKVQTYLESRIVNQKYDLVFIDPPYDLAETALAKVLTALIPFLSQNAMVIVERAKRAPEPIWPAELVLDDVRKWGDTRVWSAIYGENIDK